MEQELNPRLEEAKKGERIVYFADAVHFVHGAFVACLWTLVRIFIPTPSGRNRYNVLGAIDAIDHKLVTVCNTTYINALSVVDLLEGISEKHKGGDIPITIVLDNAKYQQCKLVKEEALKRNIELLFLPTYSPNLNIIERLWKWTKKDCLNCKYYKTFGEFKDAIDHSLNKVKTGAVQQELDSFLSLNFQLYDNSVYNRA